jgi:hypothetical protein
LLAVFTQTIPGPPPGACAIWLVLVLDELAGGVDFEGMGAGAEAAAGIAGFDAGAGAEEDMAGFADVPDAGVVVEVLEGAPYHVFTPLCPLQAPDFVAPL